MPILQLALDFADLERAIEFANETRQHVDWLEAGTPLIKSEGLNSVRELKKLFPKKIILADMKTADTGAVEVEIASKAGADIITILATSDDETIREAVKAAKRYNSQIMADLLGTKNIEEQAKRLEELGVDYILMHTGIDQQMKGINPLEKIKKLSTKTPIAVAGGINSQTAAEAVKKGAYIVIVGGAITKAPDAAKAAEEIKKAMLSKKPVATKKYVKITTKAEEAFQKTSTANISDALQHSGAMKNIRIVNWAGKIVGPAYTVKTDRGDWAKTVEAIDKAQPGDIIVIDARGEQTACWGGLASLSAKRKKIAGVVVDGAVRDVEEIKKTGLTVYAAHTNPQAGEPKGLGETGCEISCGGQKIAPGDMIIGDLDGVVVVKKQEALLVANRALDVKEKEERIRKEIQKGSTLGKILKLEKWEKHQN